MFKLFNGWERRALASSTAVSESIRSTDIWLRFLAAVRRMFNRLIYDTPLGYFLHPKEKEHGQITTLYFTSHIGSRSLFEAIFILKFKWLLKDRNAQSFYNFYQFTIQYVILSYKSSSTSRFLVHKLVCFIHILQIIFLFLSWADVSELLNNFIIRKT